MAPRRTLEESIVHLREELADGEPLSQDDRQLLDRTLEDVAAHLESEADEFSLTDSIYEELQELAGRVEQRRPNLSLILGRIVDALSQLGI